MGDVPSTPSLPLRKVFKFILPCPEEENYLDQES